MPRVLPQQELLLELLMMSGEIAVNGQYEGTILWRTLMECKAAGWLRWSEIGSGYYKAEITQEGREAARRED